MKKSYIPIVAEYFFSDKPIKDFPKEHQLLLDLAQDILTTHGTGGKFVESLIRYKFKIADVSGIHGWDGMKARRPVEIKTETVNDKNLNCMGSFPDNRDCSTNKRKVFEVEKPLLYSVGISDTTGKCIYVMETDTGKLPKSAKLFEALSVKAPRVNLSHWIEYENAWKVLYKNFPLAKRHESDLSRNLFGILNPQVKLI
jgi:hypothetical protein